MSRRGLNSIHARSCLSWLALSYFVLLFGCAPNLSLSRDAPVPTKVAPLRQAFEVVPVSGTVRVRSDDTLYDIATRYQVTPQSIIQINNLFSPYTLRTGQNLKISPPRVHLVRLGDSINLISQRYAVSPFQIAQLNNLEAPFELTTGQKLQLPLSLDFSALDGSKQTAVNPVIVAPERDTKSVVLKEFVAPKYRQDGFSWPVEGKIIVEFGPAARGVHNDGVNILAAAGTPVKVSAGGTVAFVGENIKNFGKLVLVKHEGRIISAYAHLQDIAVSEGDVLPAGSAIGTVGTTGRVDRPQLHFEIRKSRQPIDPRSLIS